MLLDDDIVMMMMMMMIKPRDCCNPIMAVLTNYVGQPFSRSREVT